MSASAQLKREGNSEPEKIIPGSRPLREIFRERYAQSRALGYGIIESGRRAGWSATSGAASKAEEAPSVRDRIAYLSNSSDERIKRQRADMERLLALRAAGNMDNFVRYEWYGKGRKRRLIPMLDLSALADLSEGERREVMAQVESFDHTKFGPKLKLVSPLDAIAQLRQLNGLDEPQRSKHEITGSGGGPIRAITKEMTPQEAAEAYAAFLRTDQVLPASASGKEEDRGESGQ